MMDEDEVGLKLDTFKKADLIQVFNFGFPRPKEGMFKVFEPKLVESRQLP